MIRTILALNSSDGVEPTASIRSYGSSRMLWLVCLFLAVLLFFSPCSSRADNRDGPAPGMQPVKIVDDLGQTISLSRPAKRIIPLYGAFAEMLFSIGAGKSVIGRTQADKFPPELALLPSVGTHMRPDIELIIGLKPDLVVISASRKEEIQGISRIVATGIPVAVFSPRTLDDMFSVLSRLGTLSDCAREASPVAAKLRERLDAVREKLPATERKQKVFFEIRAEPLTGAGQGSIVNDIIRAAGGDNVLKIEKGIVNYSLERLLFEDPDVYIIQEGPMNKGPVDPRKRAHYDRLRCVREGRIIFADEFIFSRPGPRCVDAVERLAAVLYPDRFEQRKE